MFVMVDSEGKFYCFYHAVMAVMHDGVAIQLERVDLIDEAFCARPGCKNAVCKRV